MGRVDTALPSAVALLDLEAVARRQGTGLTPQQLQGRWRLRHTWAKGKRQEAVFTSLLLRWLGASLTIASGAAGLTISNAIAIGRLELRFEGQAQLRGKRPLLMFWFERVDLRLANAVLWQRALEAPKPQRLPFFALIHRDPSGWLAARGRGGGLALWQLDAAADAE